ncbi:helix-turn-helix transcriptional regulator, partial [Streptomyces verrucosisporus]|uniref:helix-turn-helix transcriptional regulator n=1 Tax=Streptomyces verrucosisporus TaxID=1695161 RepID=UPI001F124BBD
LIESSFTRPPVAMSSEAGWYRTEELAHLLKVDPSTVRRWRTARPPQGPPFVKLSERVTLYSAADVRQWLADHRVDPEQAG